MRGWNLLMVDSCTLEYSLICRLRSWREEPRSSCAPQEEWLTCWGPTVVSWHASTCERLYLDGIRSLSLRLLLRHAWSKCHNIITSMIMIQIQSYLLNCWHLITWISHICTTVRFSWRWGQEQVGGPGAASTVQTRLNVWELCVRISY